MTVLPKARAAKAEPKGERRKPNAEKRAARSESQFAKVGSYDLLRQNFRLTEEAEGKLTKKLRSNPAVFCGSKVAQVVRTWWAEARHYGLFTRLVPPLGHRTSGVRMP